MNKWVICSLLLLLSCKNKTATSVNNYADIDFSKVDTPPVFVACKGLVDKQQNLCFEETIKKVFNDELLKFITESDTIINDNFTIKLTFHKKKEIFLDKKNNSYIFEPERVRFRKALINSLSNLQFAFPATKRGIPVTTIYTLPIKVSTIKK